MSWSTVFAARLRALFARKQLDRELDDELRFHLDMQIEDNVRAGMNPAEAQYAARRSFGALESVKETYRERRTFAVVETTGQDLRYALRTLRRSPGFAITAVTVLALAIGANTAMFSVLSAVLLVPLPYRSPEQLAMLWTENPAQNVREARSSLWDVEQWRTQSQSFVDVATFDSVSMTLTGREGVEQIVGASISANLLPLLGVEPALGRSFTIDEADQQEPVVMISHRFWQARFGGSQEALGGKVVLNDLACQIIGILPADFRVARLAADVWVPHRPRRSGRGPETWFVVGRLRAGVGFDRAQAEMNAVARRISDRLPAAERNRGISVVPLSLYMVGPESRLALWMLGGAVFCVFLIAAANVASLSLARSVARRREMAVRASLGAGLGRIVRQLLTEGLLLAAVSGVAGTLVALSGIRMIRVFGPSNLPLSDIGLDLRVLGCAFGITALAGLLLGLTPAIALFKRDVRPAGEEGGRSTSAGAATSRVRRALVITDFALAIVLLAGAGLLVRSWLHVNNIDPGFRPDRVLVIKLSSPTTFADAAQRTALYQRVLETMQRVPGVEAAGMIDDLFIENSREQIVTVEREDAIATERLRFGRDEISADFFKAVGTPLLRGRFFSMNDAPGGLPVAIINDAMARRAWPGGDPVGRRFKLGPRESAQPWYTVVGVANDMRRQGLEREPFPQMFVPLGHDHASRNVEFFIRTSSADPMRVAGALRDAVRRVEKNAPVFGITLLEQQLGAYMAQRRFQTSLLTGFSLVALIMAAVGIYGLVQYSITTRTQEIGIRMAVGAQASEIFRMVVREGLKLSLTGLLIGLLGALWLGRTGSSLLFGVSPTDPFTLGAVSLLLIAVALAACCFPARRAMKIDPIAALRQG